MARELIKQVDGLSIDMLRDQAGGGWRPQPDDQSLTPSSAAG
jgi:hypothetical protein